MKFIVLKGGETINLSHVMRFEERELAITLWLSDGTQRKITDNGSRNRFTNALKDYLIHLD
jgi:hypothetical protein